MEERSALATGTNRVMGQEPQREEAMSRLQMRGAGRGLVAGLAVLACAAGLAGGSSALAAKGTLGV